MAADFRAAAQLRRSLPLALVSVLALASPRDTYAFAVHRHAAMTAEVLAREGVPPTVIAVIVHGAVAPDFVDCLASGYCPEWLPLSDPTEEEVLNVLSAHHFDNSQLDEGVAYVNDRVYGARAELLSNPLGGFADVVAFTASLFKFGQGLHALQDFYSHSTWMECQTDLLRIGGNVNNVALWDGNPGNGCATTVQGVPLSGLQTGYFGIPAPGGGIDHDLLNKDSPSSPQGAIEVRRIFPNILIGTYYEIVSGQFGGGSYQASGLAPRHTQKAHNALMSGIAVFNLAPPIAAGGWRPPVQKRKDLLSQFQAAEQDPLFQQIAAEMDSAFAEFDGVDPTTYPVDWFGPDGVPLSIYSTASPSLSAAVRLLAPRPNPFNPRTVVPLVLPEGGMDVRVEIFDLAGRRVRLLHAGRLPSGERNLVWDGRDDDGQPVVSGAYLIRLRAGTVTQVQRGVLLR